MDISLDEYIRSGKIETINLSPFCKKNETRFKENRRENNDENDEVDIDIDVGQSKKVDKMEEDKFKNEMSSCVFPKEISVTESQQWRLTRPSIVNNHAIAIPPLMSQQVHIPEQYKSWRNNRFYNRNGNGQWGNVRKCNFLNKNQHRIGWDNQRFIQNNLNNNSSSKNLKISFNRFNKSNFNCNQKPKNIEIECSDRAPIPGSSTTTFYPNNAVNLPKSSQDESIPLLAAKLLNIITGADKKMEASIHKPNYDLKVQKDIHNIQRKPFFYKSGGGNVLSYDGPGVFAKIMPQSSGMTLNNRFS